MKWQLAACRGSSVQWSSVLINDEMSNGLWGRLPIFLFNLRVVTMNLSLRIRLLSAAVILFGGLSLMSPSEAQAAEACSTTVGNVTCWFGGAGCNTLICCTPTAPGSSVEDCDN